MKKIVVLIDFTEGSKIALKQALAISVKINAEVFALHIVSTQEKLNKAESDLSEFVSQNNSLSVFVENIVSVGSLASATHASLKKVSPDIVMVCTHGVKGVYQHLFGANILKLVQGINFPCLVVHQNMKTDLSLTNKLLFPIGPHPDFDLKIKQVTKLAKVFNALIVIYEIDRPGALHEENSMINAKNSKKYFKENEVEYICVIEDIEVMSVGYSRQTIDYAFKNDIGIICLMADISSNDEMFGFGDKENFLVNEQGISIFTCND